MAGVAMLLQASQRGWLEVRPATPHRDRIVAERHRLIWYVQKAELPPVAPLDVSPPDRAKGPSERAPQNIQANAPQPESRQMILQSPPEIRLAADLPLPNLLAWNPTPPPEPRRRFQIQTPPVQRPAAQPLETTAPEVALNPSTAPKLPVELPARPRFQVPERTPPVQRTAPKALEATAPEVALNPSAAPQLPVELPARPRFQVPERRLRAPVAPVPVAAPEAPQLALAPVPDLSGGRLQPAPEIERGPVGAKPVTAGEAPQVAVAPGAAPGTVGAVIVGLDPAPAPLPPPPGNRSAEFSAGAAAGGNGGNAGSPPAQSTELRIPHLSIASIAPAPAAVLARAAFRRQLLSTLPVTRTALATPPSSPSPDPILRGSTVYTMAVDMPNITSFDGSWTVRFTELGGSSPDDLLTAPVALRKVDPKYIASAAAEGVEGKVLLYAVIRRDGRVDQVRLVQGIDERLDASAVAAFAKWEFQPATKNGVPVELEAVVQIPFRLRKISGRP